MRSIAARSSTYLPGPLTPSANVRPPSARHRHVHEEIDVVGEIALGQSEALVLRDREQIAVAARVHGPLLERVAHRVRLGRTSSAQRVVPAHRVGDDFGQNAALGRQQRRAHAQIDVALLRAWCPRRLSLCGIVRRRRTACRPPGCPPRRRSEIAVPASRRFEPVFARGNHLPASCRVGSSNSLSLIMRTPRGGDAAPTVERGVFEAAAVLLAAFRQ